MTWLVENKDVLLGYRDGRQQAWSEIYDHYASDLRRFVTLGFSFDSRGRGFRFHGFSNPLDVDDVVQESFVRAFSESARLNYDGLHSFQNYLFAIARNLIIRDFRKVTRVVSLEEDVGAEGGAQIGLGEPEPGAEQLLINHELVQLIREFQQSLSHYDQGFFDLRFREQLSQDDTARRMRISRAKVRTIERRVRTRLVRFLKERRYLGDGAAGSIGMTALMQLLLGGVP